VNSRDPIELAKQLGLDFDTAHTTDGKYVRFTFRVPQSNAGRPSPATPGAPPPVEGGVGNVIDRDLRNAPKQPKEFHEHVARITQWREKVKPWLFVGTVDTVAVKMNLFTRQTVGKYNLRNRRRIRKIAKSEEEARRIAQTQPTPHQGIVVLDSITELKEFKTRELRDRLIARCELLGKPWDGKPTPTTPVEVPPLWARLERFAPHAVAAMLLLTLLGVAVWAFQP
jgi:hypothetical protein